MITSTAAEVADECDPAYWREKEQNGDFAQAFWDELADAGFVVYRHDDSIEGYEWAIRTGREVRKRLEELTEKWRLPELNEFTDGHWEHLREVALLEKTT